MSDETSNVIEIKNDKTSGQIDIIGWIGIAIVIILLIVNFVFVIGNKFKQKQIYDEQEKIASLTPSDDFYYYKTKQPYMNEQQHKFENYLRSKDYKNSAALNDIKDKFNSIESIENWYCRIEKIKKLQNSAYEVIINLNPYQNLFLTFFISDKFTEILSQAHINEFVLLSLKHDKNGIVTELNVQRANQPIKF